MILEEPLYYFAYLFWISGFHKVSWGITGSQEEKGANEQRARCIATLSAEK
jgi:hypothetical protein